MGAASIQKLFFEPWGYHLTLLSPAPRYHHHPHHIYECHFYRIGDKWLKTWWQFVSEPSGILEKVFVMIYYEKTFQIWILKNLVRNFSYFQAIFMNPWSRGKHSWLWIGRSGFKSRRELTFSIFFSNFWLFEKLWKTLIQCQFQNGVCHFCKRSESWKNTKFTDKMKKKNLLTTGFEPGS